MRIRINESEEAILDKFIVEGKRKITIEELGHENKFVLMNLAHKGFLKERGRGRYYSLNKSCIKTSMYLMYFLKTKRWML